jgi:hypothetical protein
MARRLAEEWLPSPDPLLKAVLDLWSSRALAAGQQLGVFAELGKGPRTAARLADTLGLALAAARDLLDALLALGWLQREGDDERAVYVSTRTGAHFLDPRSAAYLGDLLMAARSPWVGPQDAALDEPLRAHAAPPGEAATAPPEAWETAGTLMRQRLGSLYGKALALQFPADSMASTILDLHGEGARLACAWAAHAGRAQTVTSLQPPGQLPAAMAHVQACGLASRVRLLAVEPTGPRPPVEAQPSGVAAYDIGVLSLLLEPGGAVRRRARLQHAVRELAPGGRLLVLDHLADDARRHHAAALVLGLAGRMTGQGCGVITEGELRQDCRDCGLQDIDCLALPGGASVIVTRQSRVDGT